MDKKGCEYCKFYVLTFDYRMYCTKLSKRITARKKPCEHFKHFKHFTESEPFIKGNHQGGC